jgi:hypothetical protein
VARRAGGGTPQSRYLQVSDLKYSRIACGAFPLSPFGAPPPYDGGGKCSRCRQPFFFPSFGFRISTAIGYAVVDLTLSMEKRDVTFLSGMVSISFL